MDLPINNMFYGKKGKQKRSSSPSQAKCSQLYCSYKLYNILESVFSYTKRVLTFKTSGCLVDVRC